MLFKDLRMRVDCNTVRSDYDGFSAIAGIASATKEQFSDKVELDFSSSSFFEANMAAPLYSVIAGLFEDLNDVSVVNMTNEINEILQKNKFLSVFEIDGIPDNNQTALPFKIFKKHAGEQFFEYLEYYMKGKGIPKMSTALSKRFRQSLFEIFQNSAIHAVKDSGIFTCGQFYPQKHRLDFTIADAGIGIRENVRRYKDDLNINSCDAINWALKEGNTTKTGQQPGGLGLKLLKEFIRLNKGKLQIVSRFGYYEFKADGESLRKMGHDFPGTCVNIEINTKDTNAYCLKSELSNDDIF